MDRPNLTPPPRGWALITGASGGLGAALAQEASRLGFGVCLTGRRSEALAETARRLAGPAVTLTADLTDPADLDRLVASCQTHGGPWTLLVNNAGSGLAGEFAEQAEAELEAMLAVNVVALTRLTRRFLPLIQAATGPRYILNVASIGSWLPGPQLAVYYASKAFVLSLTTSLRQELRSQNIGVTALCPASLDTDFHRLAGTGGARMRVRKFWIKPEVAAQRGFRALFQRKIWVVPGLFNQIGRLFFTILPLDWSARLLAALQR